MAYTITAQRVPKEYRNKRIYAGGIIIGPISGIGGSGTGGSAYIAGNGIIISVNEISLDTNFIEVTPAQGSKLKYNNITELEVISGGIDIKNILKVGTVQERVTDAGILLGGILKVDQLNSRVGIGNASPAYDLDITGHCRITGSPLFGNHVLSLTDGTRDIGQIGGGYFRHGYFSGSVYSDDSVILNWKGTPQTLDADDNGLYTDGVFRFGDDMYSEDTTFSSGFTGAGWKLDKIGSGGSAKYSLEVDTLRVRGSMTVYELILNQIRATNGSLWVSDAAKVETVTDPGATWDYDITIDTDGGNMPIPFAVNDLLRCQQFDGRNVKYYVLQVKVINVSAGTMECDNVTGAGVPAAGDSLVRMGNTATASRQNAIYLTASDTNNPYIEVLAGVNSGTASLAGFSKARLGNLTGITDAKFGALSGYGLWSNNIYLTGSIKATAGEIAGWNIIPTTISKDQIHLSSINNGSTLGEGLFMHRTAAVGEVRTVGFGTIHVLDSYTNLSADQGFEIIKRTGSTTYKHVFRVGGLTALIAGWNFDFEALYTGTKDTDDDFNEAGGITLAADGGIHTKNFYVNPDGEVGIRTRLVRAYTASANVANCITNHAAEVYTSLDDYQHKKTITIGDDLGGTQGVYFTFDLRTNNASVRAYGKIYKGDSPIGQERSTISIEYVTQPVELISCQAGDEIRLYIKSPGGAGPDQALAENFKMLGINATEVDELTGTES